MDTRKGENTMSDEGFLVDIRIAELFFRVCRRYRLEGLKERTALMRGLVKRKKARYLRDIQPFLAGKKVLKFESRSKEQQ